MGARPGTHVARKVDKGGEDDEDDETDEARMEVTPRCGECTTTDGVANDCTVADLRETTTSTSKKGSAARGGFLRRCRHRPSWDDTRRSIVPQGMESQK